MAQPSAPAKSSSADAPEQERLSKDDQKLNNDLISKLAEGLRGYSSAAAPIPPDILQNRYRIEMAAPLREFDLPHTAAYAAIDDFSPEKPLIALVCKRGLPQRARAINAMPSVNHPSILPLVASGKMLLSGLNEERFVVFYERPRGKKLSELVARKTIPMNQQFIMEYILAPLVAALQDFSFLDISHGLINADNIYFDERVMLGPCVTEPCGLSQPFYYESLERMQAAPHAKGEGSVTQDFYALAVLALYIIHGPAHFADLTREHFILRILKEGAYQALTRDKPTPEIFDDFFRGILTQSITDRWNERQIKAWADGKRYNVLAPPTPSDGLRPLEFGNVRITTRRELAHLFSINWEGMIATLQDKQFLHWINVSLRTKELSDAIARISRSITASGGRADIQTYEMLSSIVMWFDPLGPIRINQLSMHIDGVDGMCADLHARSASQELQTFASFIELNLAGQWISQQKSRFGEGALPPAINSIVIRLDRLRTYIRNAGFGFGLERVLYDLNPDMPCMSPLLAKSHVSTLPELLLQLDKMSSTFTGDDFIDRHIAAFIASKLGITHEIRLQDTVALPAIATDRNVLALYFLGLAQKKFSGMKLPGLSCWLSIRILPLLDHVHSHSLRKKLKLQVARLGPGGQIGKLADMIVTSDHIASDMSGFQNATAQYRANANEIDSLLTPERRAQETSKLASSFANLVVNGLFVIGAIIVLQIVFK